MLKSKLYFILINEEFIYKNLYGKEYNERTKNKENI